jgi:hypothetical protein
MEKRIGTITNLIKGTAPVQAVNILFPEYYSIIPACQVSQFIIATEKALSLLLLFYQRRHQSSCRKRLTFTWTLGKSILLKYREEHNYGQERTE